MRHKNTYCFATPIFDKTLRTLCKYIAIHKLIQSKTWTEVCLDYELGKYKYTVNVNRKYTYYTLENSDLIWAWILNLVGINCSKANLFSFTKRDRPPLVHMQNISTLFLSFLKYQIYFNLLSWRPIYKFTLWNQNKRLKETAVDNTPNKTTAFPIRKIVSKFVNDILSMLEIDCKKMYIMYVHGKYFYNDVVKV